MELHEIWQAMIIDPDRLTLVASDICTALSEGRFPLVLSDRTEHLTALSRKVTEMHEGASVNGFVITSANGKMERS